MAVDSEEIDADRNDDDDDNDRHQDVNPADCHDYYN